MSLYLWDKEMSVYVGDVLVSWWSWYDWPYSYSTMQWPCDTWFHVPSKDEFVAVKNIWTSLWWWSSDWVNFCNNLKIPFWWYKFWTSVYNVWSREFLWLSTSYGDNSAYGSQFQSWTLNADDNFSKGYWCQIRPFKNSSVVPTSSWTKMYWTSIAAWWIFWSASEWLISLSKNGTDWITISDKNLGATVVWNQWDSVTDANAWYFYQWGNNYWFPHSWSTATTNTQVNASNYWPSNPYSSSNFYTNSSMNWDSSGNKNLWWWVNPSTYDYVEIDGDRYIKQ